MPKTWASLRDFLTRPARSLELSRLTVAGGDSLARRARSEKSGLGAVGTGGLWDDDASDTRQTQAAAMAAAEATAADEAADEAQDDPADDEQATSASS